MVSIAVVTLQLHDGFAGFTEPKTNTEDAEMVDNLGCAVGHARCLVCACPQ